ncbi:aldehyde dehydrogenase, thermostable (plasmid) [Pseudosulfitobacter pseudonitzschiae]|uniref:Aldehyde dehydrogenase, thermostable n=1 Tax=Pseudosulfitobacter pseudonitzschiae TaxID=1402135 RepID=A0A221K6Z2_9RHOB|nr:aldehyde dehydrogenase, thermostable [Pseudosulfitobacter pseudonitzschiae]
MESPQTHADLLDRIATAITARESEIAQMLAHVEGKVLPEAVAIANDTPFGLPTGICTTNLRFAQAFKRRSTAGMVMLSLPTAGVDYHVPFGGRKGSSVGSREQGSNAAEFYTSVKTTYTFAG